MKSATNKQIKNKRNSRNEFIPYIHIPLDIGPIQSILNPKKKETNQQKRRKKEK
jgi:hypothetical protein